MPPTRLATTGRSHAKASAITRPNGSAQIRRRHHDVHGVVPSFDVALRPREYDTLADPQGSRRAPSIPAPAARRAASRSARRRQ